MELSSQEDGGTHPMQAKKDSLADHGSPAGSAKCIRVRCTDRFGLDACGRIPGGRCALRSLVGIGGRQFIGNVYDPFVEAPE